MNRHRVTFSDGTVATRNSRTARYDWAWRIAYRRLGRHHAATGFSSSETYAQGELERRRQNIAGNCVGAVITMAEIQPVTIEGGRP